ncbi:MAG: hypothetical protein ACXWVD_00270 [Telluria sp.]
MARVTLRSFAGIRNALAAERLRALPGKDGGAVELADATNVDIDDSGQLMRRSGQVLKVSGACHSLWASGELCLYVKDGALYRLHSDYSSTLLVSGLAPHAMHYVDVNGRIYYSNGAQTGIVDGAARSWGMAVPNTPFVAAAGGQMQAGTYQVAATYVRGDGQESGAGPAVQLTLSEAGGVRVAWEAPADASIARVNVYLSEPNGMVLYLAGSAPVAAAELTVIGAALAYPLATQWLDAPPAGQCLAYANGRIYIASGEYVFATAALGYEYCDLRDYLAIDGSRIAFLAGVAGGLYIGTARAVYFATGTRLEELALRLVVDSPAVAGSAVLADAGVVAGSPEAGGRRTLLFAAHAGLYMGSEDGAVASLTAGRYQLAPGSTACGAFRASDTLHQYLLFQS